MTEIIVTFQTADGKAEKTLTDISLDTLLDEARLAMPIFLGLPENLSYRFILQRTGETLRDNLTFREAGIRSNDIIILANNSRSGGFTSVEQESPSISKALFLVTYNLQLIIPSDGHQTDIYDYPIELTEFYEDNPQRFFSDANSQEKQNFVTQIQEKVPRQIQTFEIDKILQQWCEDISLGYRTTGIRI
jgi:hypothetical protein